MPTVTYVEANGQNHEIDIASGVSLMQGAVDNMIDGIVAECGGACACATCHCYIDDSWVAKIEPASEMEKDLLDCVTDPKDNSRLSCQVKMTDALDGLVIHLPESQF